MGVGTGCRDGGQSYEVVALHCACDNQQPMRLPLGVTAGDASRCCVDRMDLAAVVRVAARSHVARTQCLSFDRLARGTAHREIGSGASAASKLSATAANRGMQGQVRVRLRVR